MGGEAKGKPVIVSQTPDTHSSSDEEVALLKSVPVYTKRDPDLFLSDPRAPSISAKAGDPPENNPKNYQPRLPDWAEIRCDHR